MNKNLEAIENATALIKDTMASFVNDAVSISVLEETVEEAIDTIESKSISMADDIDTLDERLYEKEIQELESAIEDLEEEVSDVPELNTIPTYRGAIQYSTNNPQDEAIMTELARLLSTKRDNADVLEFLRSFALAPA